MGTMITQHKITDYAKWRPAFDEHVEKQRAAGLTRPRVLRSADDSNDITILFDYAEVKKAKAFAASQDLKDTMMKAGVVGMPTISFLEET